MRVTRTSVPTYNVDEADLEQRLGRGLKTWATNIPESHWGRETRSGKEKLGLRITRGEKVGLRVTRGGKLGIRVTSKEKTKNDMYDFCKVFSCF